MLRAHVYTSVCQMGAMHTNYYVYNNNNFFATTVTREVAAIAEEMQALLPSLLSTRAIAPNGQTVRPSPLIISATGRALGGSDDADGAGVLLTARVWEEEPLRTRSGYNTSYQCVHVVVVNADPVPVEARVVVAGLTATLPTVASTRVFGSVHTLNLTRVDDSHGAANRAGQHGRTKDEDSSREDRGSWGDAPERPLYLLHTFIDGSSANVYQIGCGQPQVHPGNRAVNGNFETMLPSQPSNFRLQGGAANAWHVFAPDGPGYNCVAASKAMLPSNATVENCTVSSLNYTDDRARITPSTADPFEGMSPLRHSCTCVSVGVLG